MLNIFLLTHFICKGHTPVDLRLHLDVLNATRVTMTLDSEYHYPHTGKSWKLLMEKADTDETTSEPTINFTTYDDAFIYNLSLPQSLLSGQTRNNYSAELKWQTDENGSVFSEELLCYSLN